MAGDLCATDCSFCACANGQLACDDTPCGDGGPGPFPVCPPNEPVTGAPCPTFEGSQCRYYARCITSCICTQSTNPEWACSVACG
jgi:hypothetical protein